MDVAVALIVCLATAPLVLALALGIKLESRGPIFYRSPRVGKDGRPFVMYKFRKMWDDALGPALTSARDERFTRLGRFLARTKLDELPQLWNVLKGDMSLVGPRPEDAEFIRLYRSDFDEVLRVRPGITGLSQLAFAKEHRVLECPDPLQRYVEALLPQKILLDRLYVRSRSMGMDFKILAWTILAVLGRIDVSVHRESGELTVRRRKRGVADSAPTGQREIAASVQRQVG